MNVCRPRSARPNNGVRRGAGTDALIFRPRRRALVRASGFARLQCGEFDRVGAREARVLLNDGVRAPALVVAAWEVEAVVRAARLLAPEGGAGDERGDRHEVA